jgi:hypothetical protein
VTVIAAFAITNATLRAFPLILQPRIATGNDMRVMSDG